MTDEKYISRKPLFIIPCSDKKAGGKQAAVTLYQGLGYLPLVKQKIFTFGVDFNLAFLSAKHGLVMWDEWLSPYNQKLTKGTVGALIEKEGQNSLAKINELSPSAIIACLPKVYMMAFDAMIGQNIHCPIARTPAGGGIGYQRQFLSRQLALHVEKSLHVISFKCPSKSYMDYASVIVRVGDVIRPWMGNNSQCASVYSEPVEVVSIEGDYGLENAIDSNGNAWGGFEINKGFSHAEQQIIREKSGDRTLWYTGYKHTIELSSVQSAARRLNVKRAA
jgi:hypothetical protein